MIRWQSQVVTAPTACWPQGLSMREKARLVSRAKKHNPFSHFQTAGLHFLKKQNNKTIQRGHPYLVVSYLKQPGK